MKKKILAWIAVVLLCCVFGVACRIAYTKYAVTNLLYDYLEEQHIDRSDIKEIIAIKDVMGEGLLGYEWKYNVTYYSDTTYRYHYSYDNYLGPSGRGWQFYGCPVRLFEQLDAPFPADVVYPPPPLK